MKVTTKLMGKGEFDANHIPDHISRLFIGTEIAAIVFFIFVTEGFFGPTIVVTRINPAFLQYVYAVIAFVSGFSVLAVMDVISDIVNAVFHPAREKKSNL